MDLAMKNWGYIGHYFQHVKIGGSGKIMHFIRGGSWSHNCLDDNKHQLNIFTVPLNNKHQLNIFTVPLCIQVT